MRPGHPVLLATISHAGRTVPFWGLLRNPGVVVVCFRFLVMPYLDRILNRGPESPLPGHPHVTSLGLPRCTKSSGASGSCGSNLDILFRHGNLTFDTTGNYTVEVTKRQSLYSLKPFLSLNCWVHVNKGDTIGQGAVMGLLSPMAVLLNIGMTKLLTRLGVETRGFQNPSCLLPVCRCVDIEQTRFKAVRHRNGGRYQFSQGCAWSCDIIGNIVRKLMECPGTPYSYKRLDETLFIEVASCGTLV